MLNDPLAVPISEICIQRVPSVGNLCFPNGVYSGVMFFEELDALNAWYYDCIVFSANKSIKLNLPLRRLLTCVGQSWSLETRRYANIHTKLFIAFARNNKPIRVFVGSQNLVLPTTENLMIDQTNHKKFFVEYFNLMWNNAETI